MTTRANPLAGRYFNDPSFAAGISNLASAFAPPGADDYLAAEKMRGMRTQNDALARAAGLAGDDFDMLSIVADLYDPTQSFYKVNLDSSDTRRGQDITAQTARLNNAADNDRALREAVLSGMFKAGSTPLTYGEVMPGIDPATATAMGATAGVPVPAFGPQSGAALGAPADPLSTDEFTASLMQKMAEEDPRFAQLFALDGVGTTNTVGPEGRPRLSFTSEAALAGAEPFVNQGGQAGADLTSYITPDGREGSAIFDPNTKTLVDAATGEPLPQGTKTFKIAGGDRAAASGATTSNLTAGQRTLAEVDYGRRRVQEFRDLLDANPDILGIPGMVRSFAQDIGQAAIGMGSLLGPDGKIESLDQLRQLAETVSQQRDYNPAFARAAALALEMAYMDAKMQDPSGEVNVRELERNLSIYDGGIAGNPRVLATLDNLSSRLNDREVFARTLLGETAPPPAAPPPPAATQRPRAVNPDTGQVVEWDGQQWVPVQ